MRKFTFTLVFLLVLGFYGISIGDDIKTYTDTIGPFPAPNVKGSKPVYADLGEFEFDPLTGEITSASISGKWSGNLGSGWGFGWGLGSKTNVSLYLGDYDVPGAGPDDWILVATLTNQKKKTSTFNFMSFWNLKKSKSIDPILWSYDFKATELDLLETALADNKIDLIIGGTPSKVKKVTLIETTLTFVDPVPDTIPPDDIPDSIPSVPEPATMLLLGSGLIGLAGYGRKKFSKK